MLDQCADDRDVVIGGTTAKRGETQKRRNPPSSRSCAALKRKRRIPPVPGYALAPSQVGFGSGFWPHAPSMFPAPFSPQMRRQGLVGMSSTVNCSSSLPQPKSVLSRPIPSAACLVPSSPERAHLNQCHRFGFLQPFYPETGHFSLSHRPCAMESQRSTSMSSSPFQQDRFMVNNDSIFQPAISTVPNLSLSSFTLRSNTPFLRESASQVLRTPFLSDSKDSENKNFCQ